MTPCPACGSTTAPKARAGRSICLPCERKAHRARQAKRRVTSAAKVRRVAAEYRARHPERIVARDAVKAAVAAGKLPRVSLLRCVFCGEQASRYDHFKGYAPEHRLAVVPACSGCDGDVIALRKRAERKAA